MGLAQKFEGLPIKQPTKTEECPEKFRKVSSLISQVSTQVQLKRSSTSYQPGGEEEEVHPNIGGETAPTQMRATKNFAA